MGADSWRWMLGVEAIPAFTFFGLIFLIPKSPRWLVLQKRFKEGLVILKQLGDEHPEERLQTIRASFQQKGDKEKLFQRKYLKPIILVLLMATFNQFSGINAIMYYAPRISETAGIAKDSAFLQAASVDFVNMLFTILAMMFIDKVGRRKLMIIGSIGMILSLVATTYLLKNPNLGGSFLVIPILFFIVRFAFSQGAVIWVFISEVFPNKVRAAGQSFGTFTHWFWAASLTWLFPVVAGLTNGTTYAFGFFALAMLLQLNFSLGLKESLWKIIFKKYNKQKNLYSSIEEIATTGRPPMGWFHGFKLHLIVNDKVKS